MKNDNDQKFKPKNKIQEELKRSLRSFDEEAEIEWEYQDAMYKRHLDEKSRSKKMTFLEAVTHLEAIANAFENELFNRAGLVKVTLEEPDRVRLVICEADVFDSLICIHEELFSRGIEDENCPDAFGLLQDHFDKNQLPYDEKRRMGNAYLAFRSRLGEIPMSWVPGSPSYKKEEDRA